MMKNILQHCLFLIRFFSLSSREFRKKLEHIKNLDHQFYEEYLFWNHKNKYVEIFKQAEQKRLELIQLKQLGPEFSEKPHSGAVFFIILDNILIEDNGDLDIEISESKKRNITKVLQIETPDQGKRFKIDN
ncbi:hypothetical protein RhiirA5_418472 [Rhizophagus irregularis]|uniref:Uncharacterized protein n=1 Tax=Rhizophagus irregularis TaxID=588596 RepID=A0A2N0PK97_9GLOM|nr:hypothetical protein RhiirA5_418472 [Rhizophagus irregularis]